LKQGVFLNTYDCSVIRPARCDALHQVHFPGVIRGDVKFSIVTSIHRPFIAVDCEQCQQIIQANDIVQIRVGIPSLAMGRQQQSATHHGGHQVFHRVKFGNISYEFPKCCSTVKEEAPLSQ